MGFSQLVRGRRLDLKLGVREVARKTEQAYIPSPIKSAIYISRIEAGDSKYMGIDSVTIDKTWALGCVLSLDPFELFLLSRDRADLVRPLLTFAIRECLVNSFGDFIRSRRNELKLSLRESAEQARDWYISAGYWSQMETDFRDCTSKISGDKLWGMGTVLDVDPGLLYVLSRKMDPRYLKAASRDRLFS